MRIKTATFFLLTMLHNNQIILNETLLPVSLFLKIFDEDDKSSKFFYTLPSKSSITVFIGVDIFIDILISIVLGEENSTTITTTNNTTNHNYDSDETEKVNKDKKVK